MELLRKQRYLDGYFANRRKTKQAAPEKCAEILECIQRVEDADEREFLERRYIELEKMEFIGCRMNMSRATVFRLQAMALENLDIPEGFEK